MKQKNEVVVSVRCTKAERRAFRRAAKLADKTLSAFMAWAARLAIDTAPSLNGPATPELAEGAPRPTTSGQERSEARLEAGPRT